MTPEEHIKEILDSTGKDITAKYMRGYIEHASNLWEISDEQLDKEIDGEIYDLLVYLGERQRRARLRT